MEILGTISVWIALFLFFVYFTLDAINSYFTIQVIKMYPIKAATAGCVMHLLIALGVFCYVSNPFYLIPMVMGSWVGIFTMLKISKSKINR